jgi:protein-disulfide isomerase
MKLLFSLAVVAALVGCEQSKSRLDSVPRSDMKSAESAKAAEAAKAADGAGGATPSAAPAKGKIDRSGSVEQQLARLQDAYDRNAEAIGFLNEVYAQQKAQRQAQEESEPAEDAMFAVDVADGVKAGQVDGPASAPVTIVKAFDFACPYCQRVSATLDELVKEYNGKVRVVYTNMVVHEPARPAHLASCAAAKQGKYKDFKNAFWEKGFLPYAQARDASKLGEENILAIAKEMGLDTGKLKTDMASPECAARIDADMKEMTKFHVNATPTFFINGKLIPGALSKEQFKSTIDEQLKVAAASGVPAADYYSKVVIAKGEKQFRSKSQPKP